jgi:hypothetical protein
LIPEQPAVEAAQHHDVAAPSPAKPAVADKEPTTVRFSRQTLLHLDKVRFDLHSEQNLRVTRSDIIEAAVRTVMKTPTLLHAELQAIKDEK